MSKSSIVKSNLPTLAAAITQEHLACIESAGTAAEHAWKAGKLLLQAKGQVQHGQWETWLKENTQIGVRTAQVYMRLAKRSTAALEGMSIRSILRSLAALDPVPVLDRRRGHRQTYTNTAGSIEPTHLSGLREWSADLRECRDEGKGYTSPGDPTQMRDKTILKHAVKMVEAGFRELEREDHALANKITAEWLLNLIQNVRR